MRAMRITGNLLLGTMLMVGCTENGSVKSLVGEWDATSFTVDGEEVLVGMSLSLTLTFISDGTFSDVVTGDTGHFLCGADVITCADDGRYIQTDINLLICDPLCGEILEYTVSGNTLNIVLTDPTEGPPLMFTFVRSSA